jgi:hypothetical protein
VRILILITIQSLIIVSVEAVMLNGNTPKREVEETYERLMNPPANGGEGIKLLYVTVSSHAL